MRSMDGETLDILLSSVIVFSIMTSKSILIDSLVLLVHKIYRDPRPLFGHDLGFVGNFSPTAH